MKSLYGKLIIGFFVSIVFSFSVAGYFSINSHSDKLGQMTIKELNNSLAYIIELADIVSDDELPVVLQAYSEASSVSFTIETEMINETYGKMDEELNLSKKDRAILYQNPKTQILKESSTIKQLTKSYVIDGQQVIISIQKDANDRETIFLDSAVVAVFCMIIAGSIMFIVLADIIVKPIARLNKATHELSKGNYRVRVNYSGNDEIATLNRSFNQMAQQLAKSEEIRQQFISDVSQIGRAHV